MSSLFDLNDRIFQAMDDLNAAIEAGDDPQNAVAVAKAKSQLFSDAINNANTIMRAAQMQESAMDDLAMKVGTSRLLLGQPVIQASAEIGKHELPDPEFDAIEWIAANAEGLSISVIRQKLNKAADYTYSFDEVRAMCEEARVEPRQLDEKNDMKNAEIDSYGLRGPAKGYVR